MKELFVSYEISKALKEKGFNEPCFRWYKNGIDANYFGEDQLNSDCVGYDCVAPLYQQVISWFEKNMIFIFIDLEHLGSDEYGFRYIIKYLPKEHWNLKRRMTSFQEIQSFSDNIASYSGAWDTRKEALDKAIEEALKLI